jgi:hypothetical protein
MRRDCLVVLVGVAQEARWALFRVVQEHLAKEMRAVQE